MKLLTVNEMRTIDGGYSTTCPVCGKKISVFFLNVWLMGKKMAYAHAQQAAQAQHWSYRTGYNPSKDVH